jgi:hypothetical protein
MKRYLVVFGLCTLAVLEVGILRSEETPAKPRIKSVTVYPVVIMPSENIPASIPQRIAEVVGLLLEKAGMNEIEIAESSFSGPKTDDMSKIADAFGQFVGKQSLKTEYAIFCQIMASDHTITGIRSIVVDKSGKVIFADLSDQKAFSESKIKPDEPMTACIFLVNRLGNVWDLADPMRENAPEGKMAELMRKRSALPPDKELADMNNRLEILKKNIAVSKITVYPIRLWEGSDKTAAVELAKMLNDQKICQAEPSDVELNLKIQGDPNEQKVLWDTARAFREFLRANPPATEYAMLADYGISPASDGKQEAGAVHLIICDHKGDWVLADYQNSHHPDFQSINPKTIEDCNQLAVKRLKKCLSKEGEADKN